MANVFCGDIVISILQHRVKIAETGEVIEVSDEDIEKVSIICVTVCVCVCVCVYLPV